MADRQLAEAMIDQQRKDLEYLRHVMLNCIVKLKALVIQGEELLKVMSAALCDYEATWEGDDVTQARGKAEATQEGDKKGSTHH